MEKEETVASEPEVSSQAIGLGSGAVVVTGGARGIGEQIAREVAQAGTPVALIFRSHPEGAARIVDSIAAMGGQATAIRADIGIEADVVRAFATVDDTFGSFGGLVNNAVIAGVPTRFEDLNLDEVESLFRTNVFGALLCTREAVKRLSTRHGGGGGAIVTISSRNAISTGGAGGWIGFAASKGALETMSLGLAKDLAGEGIRSNVVRAGMIGTATRLESPWHKERLAEGLAHVPLARLGRPTEVAAAVLWLLSAEASYVTGAVLDVAGGLS